MSDIVERLREGVFGTDETKTDAVIHSHMQAAADEIERLRAERDEAIDQRNAADFVLALSIEQSTRHSVERDAARVEIERLNEAIISERHGWQAEVERLRREVMRVGGVAP